jgi:hypothetical protein
MAAGLAVASPAVGDVAEIVSPDNARFITPPGDEGALAQAMLDLALDELARRRAGAANRVIATRDYDESVMAQRYARIYADALGLPNSRNATLHNADCPGLPASPAVQRGTVSIIGVEKVAPSAKHRAHCRAILPVPCP